MALVKEVSYGGQGSTSTLNGQIRIDEGRGRMVVFDNSTNVDLVTIDRTGFLFSDGSNRRIKIGSYAARVGIWQSKTGLDVITLLGG